MTSWWNKNIPGERLEEFKSWLTKGHQTDRVYCRKHIAEQQYKSFLDCGCGIAVEYFGFKTDNYPIEYTGLDSCTYLIELNKSHGIQMIDAELDNPLPIKDNAYDCVYAREIMEHLQYHRRTLDELIRVAKKEVVVTWFIRPDHEPEDIRYRADEDLYHNKYNIDLLEKFILSNDKVESISWHEPNEKHLVLHIKLKLFRPRFTIEERDRMLEEARIALFTHSQLVDWNNLSEAEKEEERKTWHTVHKKESQELLNKSIEKRVEELAKLEEQTTTETPVIEEKIEEVIIEPGPEAEKNNQ